MLLTRDKWSSGNLKYWEMVEILGRYICLCSQEVINNAASAWSHGKGVQWSLPSGRRGIMRHLPHEGVPSQELIQNWRLWGGLKEQKRSLILVTLNVDPAMLCVHIIFGHISSFFFLSLSLLPLKFSCLLPFHPLMSDSFCTAHFYWIFIISASSWFQIVFLGPRLSRRTCCCLISMSSSCEEFLEGSEGLAVTVAGSFGQAHGQWSRETWELHAHHHCIERSLRWSVQRLVSWTGKGWHGNNISRPVSTHLVKLYTFHGP